jgi:hypothetical protein
MHFDPLPSIWELDFLFILDLLLIKFPLQIGQKGLAFPSHPNAWRGDNLPYIPWALDFLFTLAFPLIKLAIDE